MKAKLSWVKSSKENWLTEANQVYEKKIGNLIGFSVDEIKSVSVSRDQKNFKIEEEEKKILKKIDDRECVVIFDENGKSPSSSEEFSKWLDQWLSQGKTVHFVVGGAFGLGEAVKKRSNHKVCLSNLTLSHQVANVMVLEQIYRGLSISRGLPYHNPKT